MRWSNGRGTVVLPVLLLLLVVQVVVVVEVIRRLQQQGPQKEKDIHVAVAEAALPKPLIRPGLTLWYSMTQTMPRFTQVQAKVQRRGNSRRPTHT
jgi:hypothetical protein